MPSTSSGVPSAMPAHDAALPTAFPSVLPRGLRPVASPSCDSASIALSIPRSVGSMPSCSPEGGEETGAAACQRSAWDRHSAADTQPGLASLPAEQPASPACLRALAGARKRASARA
eukprot:365048-Chlamydomonas_euryale.AAC.7